MPPAPSHANADRVDQLSRFDVIAARAIKSAGGGSNAIVDKRFDDFADVVAREKRVGIAKRDVIAARGAHRLIRRRRETSVLMIENLLRVWKALENARG